MGLEFRKLVTQGLPIALTILYLLFPAPFVQVSIQPLGKCIAVAMIVLLTYQDMMHGFVICLLTIIYYQGEVVEGFLVSKTTQNYADFLPKPSLKEDSITFQGHLGRDFTSVGEAYPDTLQPIRKVSEHLFRKDFCHSTESHVLFKDQKVGKSLISHVYPELTFRDGDCNPCDRTCHFTINRKQDAEEDIKPKSSKYSSLLEMAKYVVMSNKEEPVVVFKDQVATKTEDH